MSRVLAIAMLLSGTALAAGADTEPPSSEPWRYNTRGRTDSGIELQQKGALDEALQAFGTALGLSPGDPLLRYNAGTAAILGADPRAVELLQAAVDGMPDNLKPLVHYNLGNAFFGSDDFRAAIDAYKDALRLAPDNTDAKHNLELALKRLQQQQQQEQQQEQENNEEQQEQQQEQQSQQEQDSPQPQPQEQDQQQQDPSNPLPDFEEQPDMTAEQAAAILEAVENLEREQRRKQALEQLKRAKGDRDW